MNYYQQNNALIKITSINVVSIEFRTVVIGSNIENVLNGLKVAYGEFYRRLGLDYFTKKDLSEKAVEINSIVGVLIDSAGDLLPYEKYDFIENAIKTTCAIIQKYDDAVQADRLDRSLYDDLIKTCRGSLENVFGSVSSEIWVDLQFYEWLKKEGFVSWVSGDKNWDRHFSDDYLEEFFLNNRRWVIEKMLRLDCRDGKLMVRHPFSNDEALQYYRMCRMLPM